MVLKTALKKSLTYDIIPERAMITPRTDLSVAGRPEVIQPRETMVHVFTWPTTVLDTGPVWAMMKNWDMLIMQAQRPDWFGPCQSTLHTVRGMRAWS